MACTKDMESNINKAIQGIRDAAARGANILCLQELFSTLYFCDVESYDNFKHAEPVPGPTTLRLQELAAELNIVIVAPLFEKRANGLYHNSAVVIDADGKLLGLYRKNHIPDDPGFYEKFYFTPGDTGYGIYKTHFATIAILICWDQWYPEAARITSLMGAEILFYPTAIGWALSQPENVNAEQHNAWQTIQCAHAIANGVFVVTVNRTGTEGNMRFWGGSFISNPFGSILYKASHDAEEVAVRELNLSWINFYRTHWPFLRDRRTDTYAPILNRYIDEKK
ncbi:MAG: carbon-nitrogen hydrolase [Bacteroidales bacterium]|nr:carbon-nitrogen hydrolase [Bacteroidales bacterium]